MRRIYNVFDYRGTGRSRRLSRIRKEERLTNTVTRGLRNQSSSFSRCKHPPL
nr:MAG TPA: hypothetical protein [Caudoviricetes sp.]